MLMGWFLTCGGKKAGTRVDLCQRNSRPKHCLTINRPLTPPNLRSVTVIKRCLPSVGLVRSWILTPRQPRWVTSEPHFFLFLTLVQNTSLNHKPKAGSHFWTQHSQQQTQSKSKTVNKQPHLLHIALGTTFPIPHASSQGLKYNYT